MLKQQETWCWRDLVTACENSSYGTRLKILGTVQRNLLLFALIWCSKRKIQSTTTTLRRFCLLAKAGSSDDLVNCVGRAWLHDNDTTQVEFLLVSGLTARQQVAIGACRVNACA